MKNARFEILSSVTEDSTSDMWRRFGDFVSTSRKYLAPSTVHKDEVKTVNWKRR
jgi:hypothetical protein